MREILFRGKRTDNKEWVISDCFFQCSGKIKLWDEPNRDGWVEVIPETVGQFTGLTDKNGTKIFEGDIVKAKIVYSGLVNVFTKEEIVVVKYIEGCFYPLYDYVKKEIEVIGNIHDNPELLGE